MAVDTRNKRMSLIGLASPVPSVLPNPDGSFGQADRQQLLWGYAGILWAAGTAIEIVCDFAVTVSDIVNFDVTVSDIMNFDVKVGC